MSPTVCVWLTAAAESVADVVLIETVPAEAARFPTEWECPLVDVEAAYVWVCPLAAVWLE